MTTRSFVTTFIFSIILTLCISCSPKGENKNLQEALELYRENKLEKALPYFERATEEQKDDADALAWLAETYRRLHKNQEAVKSARKALELNGRHSFAHTVIADACNPQFGEWEQSNYDTTWQHLLLAVQSDPDDGNAWLGIWIEGMRRGEDIQWKNALRAMVRTKFITPTLLSYNRWVLNRLPQNAVLFTNGDMDTYPAAALQIVEQFRTDIAIVNISLLNMPWYAHFISKQYHIPLPLEDQEIDSLKAQWGPNKSVITISNQIVQGWIRMKEDSRFSSPVTVALTADRNSLPDIEDHLQLAGAYYVWFPQTVYQAEDLGLLRNCVENIHPSEYAGSCVSPQDRSPIRLVYSNTMAQTMMWVILYYSELLIRDEQFSEASQALDRAETIDKNLPTGRIFTDRIAGLRRAAKH